VPVLNGLSEQIRECLQHAEECARKAAELLAASRFRDLSNWTDASAAFYSLIACIAAVILLTFLHWRQRRLSTAVQARLESLSRDVRRLEIAHESLLVRFMNLPRLPTPALELEAGIAPTQPDEKSSSGSAQKSAVQNLRLIKSPTEPSPS
jgi:hypothetical protein